MDKISERSSSLYQSCASNKRGFVRRIICCSILHFEFIRVKCFILVKSQVPWNKPWSDLLLAKFSKCEFLTSCQMWIFKVALMFLLLAPGILWSDNGRKMRLKQTSLPQLS